MAVTTPPTVTGTGDPAGGDAPADAAAREAVQGAGSEVVQQAGPEGPAPAPVVDVATAGAGAADESRPGGRLAVAIGFSTLAAAVMAGGVFQGVGPRFYAAVAGLAGVGLAVAVDRMRGRALATNVAVVAGLFAIGLLMVTPAFGEVGRLRAIVTAAAQSGDVLRPPVELTVGWKVILGWLMATLGFAAAWVAVALDRPSLGLLLPLPMAAFAGISVPERAQVPSGIAVLVLFAVGLGILSSEQAAAGSGEGGAQPSLGFEIRKALKALPLLAAVTAALVMLARADILFPDPLIDPAQEPQKPKTQPLTEVEDRVLFEVESQLSGPWRIGSLDFYEVRDGTWRLPPFAASELKEVPRSGIVDPELQPSVGATFTVAGLGGAVLPVLPNTVGVVASGPRLAYDARNANLRLVNGQLTAGLTYTVAAAALPSVDDLKAVTDPLPRSVMQFTEIPSAPPAVQELVGRAPKGSKWEEFDFLRTFVLENVTAAGTGTPVPVTPERVQEILGDTKKASPYEIVAVQAMLARWIGVPSRIGYGFDGGEQIDGKLQVRPRDGAAFVEVYFPGYKWLPVIGVPKKAEATVGGDPSQQRVDPSILPSDDIAVQVFLPVLVPPPSVLGKQIAVTVLVVGLLVLLLVIVYVLWPALRKARLRARRREVARAAGTRARVALAYAEWRDLATDFGFLYPTDTPLMFLDRFVDDDEHTELAWLTTRLMWGDLQDSDDPFFAVAAEELSRSLRRRLASAQPATVRAVAVVSRLSLRNPYGTGEDTTGRRRRLSLRRRRKSEAPSRTATRTRRRPPRSRIGKERDREPALVG